MNVEAIFRYVDADEDGALFVHNPTLQMRARGPSSCPGVGTAVGGADRTKPSVSGFSSPRRARVWPPPLSLAGSRFGGQLRHTRRFVER